MKPPSQCPYCGRSLLNEDVPTVGLPYWRKSCIHVPSHSISMWTVPGNDDELHRITIRVKDGLLISWDLKKQKCWLSKTMDLEWSQELPFWEPDLSDYQKLITKIKIYILFS